MLNRRMTAFLLAGAMALTLCGGAVFAADPAADGTAAEEQGAVQTAPVSVSAPAAEKPAAAVKEEPADEQEAPAAAVRPDSEGTVSFANLESRMRENNLTILSLEETIQALETVDYEDMEDTLRDQLNMIASAQWGMITGMPGLGSMMASSMDSAYGSLKDTFEDLKDGKIQEDNEALIRQLKNAQNQLLMAGEDIYTGLLSLQISDDALTRQSAYLNRTIQELELRYGFGQISALTLQETKAGRTALISGQDTLRMNMENLKVQMELMVGADIAGTIRPQPLPRVSGKELASMNLEKDLETARANSYTLFAAQRTLDDAKETYKDSVKGINKSEVNPDYVMAKHTLDSAQYTYEASIQSFESGFRTLYLQVKDCKQILDAAEVALAVERDSYAAAQLKHEQGTLSHSKLLDAADELATAEEKVETSAINLFSAYNDYRWAVDHGMVN